MVPTCSMCMIQSTYLVLSLNSVPKSNIPLADSRNYEYVCLLLRKSYKTSKDHNAKLLHEWDLHSTINLKGFVWCCNSQGFQYQKGLKLAIIFLTTSLNIRRNLRLLSPFTIIAICFCSTSILYTINTLISLEYLYLSY